MSSEGKKEKEREMRRKEREGKRKEKKNGRNIHLIINPRLASSLINSSTCSRYLYSVTMNKNWNSNEFPGREREGTRARERGSE